MTYTWVVDRTGRNVIHRAGCSHIRMNDEVSDLGDLSLEQAIVRVASDNVDPDITTAEEAEEWVSISPCAR